MPMQRAIALWDHSPTAASSSITRHGSIEEFHGQWYVFYHRSSGNCRANRRLCVEKICFNDDGTIDEVRMTSQGAGEPFAPGEAIEGWRACEVEELISTAPILS